VIYNKGSSSVSGSACTRKRRTGARVLLFHGGNFPLPGIDKTRPQTSTGARNSRGWAPARTANRQGLPGVYRSALNAQHSMLDVRHESTRAPMATGCLLSSQYFHKVEMSNKSATLRRTTAHGIGRSADLRTEIRYPPTTTQ
jgi:hypothetical protein